MPANHLSSLKEDRTHGTQSFRCACYKTDPDIDGFFVEPHWHDELEILHFKKGYFTLEINMERYDITSECLFFIRSGELHRINCAGPCTESAVVFSPYLLGFLTNDAAQSQVISPLSRQELLLPRSIGPNHPVFHAVLSEYGKVTSYCRDQIPAPETPASHQLLIKGALLNILGLLSEAGLLHPAKSARNENIESIKTVLSYIHVHYAEKIFVKDLADLLSLNEQYFCRFFKKAIGQSPISYLNDYRIRRAMDLLTDTTLPVTDVCLECGFNNFGNFLREFRKQTGTTPLQYRLNSSEEKSK